MYVLMSRRPILALIEPRHPKVGNGTQLMPRKGMPRIYFMQQ